MPGYVTIFRRHLALVLLLGLAGLLAAVAAVALRDPGYEATADVQLEQVESPFRSSGGTRGDLTRAMQTQIDIAMGDAVQRRVRAELGTVPEITVTAKGERDELQFTAVADTGERAAEIANTWAASYVDELRADVDAEAERYLGAFETLYERVYDRIAALDAQRESATGAELDQLNLRREVLVTQVKALAGRRTPDGTASAAQIVASPVRAAQVPEEPVADGAPRLLALGLLGGLVLGYLLACLKEYRRDEVRDGGDVGLVAPGTAVLGPLRTGDDVTVLRDSATAAGFHALRAEVSALSGTSETSPVLAVTSAHGETATADVAAGLAASLASAGRRVVLIDADLQHPRLHALFSTVDEPGLVNVLHDGLPTDAALVPVRSAGGATLWLLPAGAGLRDEPVAVPLFPTVVRSLVNDPEIDVVIISSPRVLGGADGLAVAEVASSVLVVATPRQTRRRSLAAALSRVALAHPPVSAVVLASSGPADDRKRAWSGRSRERAEGTQTGGRPNAGTDADRTLAELDGRAVETVDSTAWRR